MADYPTMPLRTDALIGDTMHLTAAEFGGYVRLLVAMWRNGATLPDDEKRLMRFAGMTAREWRGSRDVLMGFMTRTESGDWTQKRLRKEWLSVADKCNQAARAANARWLKEKETADADASAPQCGRNATHDPVSKETTNVVSEKRARAPRKSVPPKDWRPDPEQVAYAIAKGLSHDAVETLAENFCDWHQSRSQTRSPTDNFNATWKTWVRREAENQKDHRNVPHPQQSNTRHRHAGGFDAAMRYAARRGTSGGDTGGSGGDATGGGGMDCGPGGGSVVAFLAAG